MPNKIQQKQLQKDLDLITEVITNLNDKRVELSRVSDELIRKGAERDSAQKDFNEFLVKLAIIQEDLEKMQLLKASKIRELHFLEGKVSEKELKVIQQKNLTTVEKVKIEALRQIRESKDKELKILSKQLEKEFNDKDRAAKDLAELGRKLETIKRQTEDKKAELDNKIGEVARRQNELKNMELALSNESVRLEKLKNILRKFAQANNLPFNI